MRKFIWVLAAALAVTVSVPAAKADPGTPACDKLAEIHPFEGSSWDQLGQKLSGFGKKLAWWSDEDFSAVEQQYFACRTADPSFLKNRYPSDSVSIYQDYIKQDMAALRRFQAQVNDALAQQKAEEERQRREAEANQAENATIQRVGQELDQMEQALNSLTVTDEQSAAQALELGEQFEVLRKEAARTGSAVLFQRVSNLYGRVQAKEDEVRRFRNRQNVAARPRAADEPDTDFMASNVLAPYGTQYQELNFTVADLVDHMGGKPTTRSISWEEVDSRSHILGIETFGRMTGRESHIKLLMVRVHSYDEMNLPVGGNADVDGVFVPRIVVNEHDFRGTDVFSLLNNTYAEMPGAR